MKGRSILGFSVILTVLGLSSEPIFSQSQQYPNSAVSIQSQSSTIKRPSSALVTAIRNAIKDEFRESSNIFDNLELTDYVKTTVYFVKEVDLNNDGSKETLVYFNHGFVCSNRSCPVYIFERKGSNYRLISSSVLGSRSQIKVALLQSQSNGWPDIAIPLFYYDTRTIDWTAVRFDGKKYQLTSQRFSSTPNRIVLSGTPGLEISLADPGEQMTATGRSPSPLQTYRDTRALGMAQFLQEKQELISAQDKLQRAAKEQRYDIVDIPSTDFLTNPFTNVAELPGTLFGKRKDVSYADYLKLKLKLKAQETIFNDGISIVKAIEPYNDKLNKENRQGGIEVSQRISSNFNNYWSRVQEQNKEPSLSLENLVGRLHYAIEETRISDINLITGGVQTGGKLASAFTDLGGLVKLLNLPELTNPESFQRVGRSLDYVFTVKEKLEDIKDALLKGNNEKVNDINLEIARETIKLIDATEAKSIRTAEAIAIRSEAMNLIDRHNFLQQSQLTEVLDGFDKIYLTTAQVSSAIKIVTSTLAFVAPGKQVVQTFANKADAVNALLFDALQFSYKDAVHRQYDRLEAYSNHNQQMISGLSSSIDFSAQEIGQYLIRTRTDVVTRRPDGTIAVSVKGVVSPP